jgi:hypothetical protein
MCDVVDVVVVDATDLMDWRERFHTMFLGRPEQLPI